MFKDMIDELVKGADVVIKTIPVYEREIKMILARCGQDAPHASDRVKAKFTVVLPSNDNGESLVPELRFGMRVCIMGEWLYDNWGVDAEDGRSLYECGYGNTWREAAEYAVATNEENINSLLEQIAIRKKALEDADERV